MEIEQREVDQLAVDDYESELKNRYEALKYEFVNTIAGNEAFIGINEVPVPLKVLELANQLYEIEKLRMILDPERVLLTRHWE
jgi:hypothetical protein